MNLPNIISLSRIPLLFIIAGILYSGKPGMVVIAFVLFVLGAMSDWLDGYLARKSNRITEFGKVIDAVSDKIFILGLFIALLTLRELPDWSLFCILIMVAREFFITALRVVAASKGLVLAAEKEGKVKTVFQLMSLGILILHILLKCEGACLGVEGIYRGLYWLGVGSFLVSVALTIQSGYIYISKYGNLFKE